MSHVRTQIRDAVAEALAPIAFVHRSRYWPLEMGELPAILVYAGSEESEASSFDVLERRLQVIVEIISQASPPDTTMDDLIVRAEAALGTDVGLGGKALHCLLAATDISVSGEGSAPITRARMTYVAHYRTSFADPETPLAED